MQKFKSIDAVFILNQNASLNSIVELIKNLRFSKVLFITSHHFFDNELIILNNYINNIEYEIKEFREFFNDSELEQCDNAATEKVLKSIRNHIDRCKYNYFFVYESKLNKNKLLFKKLIENYNFIQIYYNDGLGICGEFWHSKGGIILDADNVNLLYERKKSIKKFLRKIQYFKNFIISQYRLYLSIIDLVLICENENMYFFHCSLKRLLIEENIDLKEIKIKVKNYWNWFILLNGKGNIIRRYFRKKYGKNSKIFFCSTIHEYSYDLIKKVNYDTLIFVDGFNPSNYPRSYIDTYFHGKFVPRDMFDKIWFESYNKKTQLAPAWIKKPFMNINTNFHNTRINNIFLMLNHTGDWTAIINRSDTDVLIENFVRLCYEFPQIKFVIRLHPTMDDEQHEGVFSKQRVEKYINSKKLPNLEISNNGLSSDLEASDLVISEYSNVLLDAFRMGKAGLIANFTGRRSFMEDYEKIGFCKVNSYEEMKEVICFIINHPDKYLKKQYEAVKKYNQSLERLMNYKK